MTRVHGKLINTANPLDLFQLRVPARMMWDMQLTKASDWLTSHRLVSLPVSVGSQSNPPADICALTIWGPWVSCDSGLLYVFANYWDGLLLLGEFGSRSHLDNKWEPIRVDDETRHEHKCTLNRYVAPADLHFHFKHAHVKICHLRVFSTSLTRPNKSVFFQKLPALSCTGVLFFHIVTRSHKAFVTIATLACFSPRPCVSVFPSQPLSEWARFTGLAPPHLPIQPFHSSAAEKHRLFTRSIFNNHSR